MIIRRTSMDAARAVAADAGLRREAVLRVYETHVTPLTTDDVSQILGWPLDTVRPRTTELIALGYLVATGERRVTRAGRARKAAGKSATSASLYRLVRVEAKAS